MIKASLSGLSQLPDGQIGLCWAEPDGTRRQEKRAWQPFAWALPQTSLADGASVSELTGPGRWTERHAFADVASWQETMRADGRTHFENLRPLEHQWLLQHEERVFREMRLGDLRRCQLDIETATSEAGTFSDPGRPGDRVLAIGLWFSDEDEPRLLELTEQTDAAERVLLKEFVAVLQEKDPDILEGHNLFDFDLNYLDVRSRRYRVARAWGRFDQPARRSRSRLRVAERWIDYLRYEIPGRMVFDTFLAVQMWDLTARALPGYGLKEVAVHLGFTEESDARTYLAGEDIATTFTADREAFRAYLRDDLRETRALADLLLPTYIAQAQNFPMLPQEVYLRGTGQRVDTLLLERYYHADAALPDYPQVASYEGGFTKSFATGVYRDVLHFDVASLYPSLLLQIGRGPAGDHLGVFLDLLKDLRSYRLTYKERARTATDPAERAEANARQASFKILINSFYGYLGFPGARFADGDLAAEVTRRGRELLQALIEGFNATGATVLEADTDGLYLAAAPGQAADDLLAAVAGIVPAGIALEFDGAYEAMFCYKAKNYALLQEGKITVRGSALRSRGTEPFLRDLTNALIAWKLGANEEEPATMVNRLAAQITDGSLPVEKLAKSEFLSMSPEAYAKKMAEGGKPRRASLEVALPMEPRPTMGTRVRYYLAPKEKGQTADWQRAQPLEAFDPITMPYDPKAYLKKLKDWQKRYGDFLE